LGGSKIRVLLADDHVVLREATAELVDHQADMKVVGQTGTGEETIVAARKLCPDVVVMDIAMPRLDGLEATRRILAECPGTRVLVLSAHEDAEHVIPLLEAGAVGYLPKTVRLNEFLDAIRSASRGESVLPPSVASVVVRHLSGVMQPAAEPDLTEREMEVLRLLRTHLSSTEIAEELRISANTTRFHIKNIYGKLGVHGRSDAVERAGELGLL